MIELTIKCMAEEIGLLEKQVSYDVVSECGSFHCVKRVVILVCITLLYK